MNKDEMTSKEKAIEALGVYKTVYKNSLNAAKEKGLYLVGAPSIESSIKTIETFIALPSLDDAIAVVESKLKSIMAFPYANDCQVRSYLLKDIINELTALRGLKEGK